MGSEILDGTGLNGTLLNYALMTFFLGAALFIFIYFWWKGLLCLDEEAKVQMMKDENSRPANKGTLNGK
ncbi:hypothetical protein AB751O23_AN_00080 [Chlamydiales bacterium SCGC AB-751-O23]|jgi:hypothetical protein|nr:hypothetical protein AB751O23_AN_00080 [Chlamydiales bacterium SCGC AB-751-O23]